MANPSPLHDHYDQLGALFMPYGDGVRVLAEAESHEIEYAALRKSVGLLDCPHRGLLRITGADRLDFLHRMLTNDCLSLRPGDVRRNFLLDARGRIIADLLAIHDEPHTLLDLPVHDAPTVAAELDKMLFAEDVRIEDLSDSHHRLSLHGPRAAEAAAWWRGLERGAADAWTYRYDELAEPGFHIWTAAEATTRVTEADRQALDALGLRPLGWLAFNIARIEAGRTFFHIDFGPDSLPHETGALHEACSFTKGCYRGQEIVARMESLGHPAKVLVGFRASEPAATESAGSGSGVPPDNSPMASGSPAPPPHHPDLPPPGPPDTPIPIAAAPVLDAPGPDANTVGAVTSSAYSPMLGHAPIGFAIVKWPHRNPGTTLYAPAEGHNIPITIHPLRFYPGNPQP